MFQPNGRITHETCPVCGEESVEVEHGYVLGAYGRAAGRKFFQHYWHCPSCGDFMSYVMYDCPECLSEEQDDAA